MSYTEISLFQGGVSIGEAEANANLIAAAPDLLEACRSALKVIEENIPVTAKVSVAGIARILRAAIAKAEGRDA